MDGSGGRRDRCWWLAADFDGPGAMFDALMYVKAGRALQAPVALEVSRSGVGAHAWVFFTAPVPAEAARRLGSGLLREATALRGRMNLASYDRLFPSQDLLPAGGVGNLIAAPLFKPARRDGATVRDVIVDWTDEFDRWLDHAEKQGGRILTIAVALLQTLTDLPTKPAEESATFKRVRQARRHELWRVAHPFDPEVAVRIICWFPADDEVVIALIGFDKKNRGRVLRKRDSTRGSARRCLAAPEGKLR